MKFETYWGGLDPDAQNRLADKLVELGALKAKSSKRGRREYLYQIANGYRTASPRVAMAIEEATKRKVKKEELRPDVYGGRLRHGPRPSA